MNFFRLLRQNVRYRFVARQLPVILGAILCTAVLTGALIIGDSVRYSLHKITLDRLGSVTHAIESGERTFRAVLANEISDYLDIPVAPVLQLNGIALTPGGRERVYQVHINGINQQFTSMFPASSQNMAPSAQAILINTKLAQKLDVQVGDELTLRIQAIDQYPADAPLAPDALEQISINTSIAGIVPDEEFGRYSLATSQVAPYNVFMDLSILSKLAGIPDRGNTLLFANPKENPIPENEIERSLKFYYNLNDAGYRLLKQPQSSTIDLSTSRIFIEPAIENAVANSGLKSIGYFTYFINRFKAPNGNTTPYSFISTDPDLQKGEMIINKWLADDLKADKDIEITLSYYIMGHDGRLLMDSTSFQVSAIRSMRASQKDQSLLPEYPGIAGTENCRDWEPGIPIDLDLIRDKDEQYWDEYGGTPKAWVSLDDAQRLWGNRYGHLTTIQFNAQNDNAETIENKILDQLSPASFGLYLQPVRQQGLAASKQGVDFGELFIGLSFFVIAAALLLTGLLFVFGLEKRTGETALYMTLGYKPLLIRFLYLVEFNAITVPAIIIGVLLGMLYNQVLLGALSGIWIDVVGTSDLVVKIKATTLLTGGFATFVLLIISILGVLKFQSMRTIIDLKTKAAKSGFQHVRLLLWYIIVFILSCGILFTLFSTDPGRGKDAYMPFFGGGSMLLALGLVLFYLFMYWIVRLQTGPAKSLHRLAIINLTRNLKRSLSMVLILSIGIFLVVAIGANRHGALTNADQPGSGTGGFQFWLQTTVPVLKDLQTPEGLDFIGLDPQDVDSINILPMRLLAKDDASCLNLNRISQPAVLGLNPEILADREAFTFIKLDSLAKQQQPWLSLKQTFQGNVIPGIIDETVLVWGIAKTLGDTLYYNNENGEQLGIKIIGTLANSVFQGHVMIWDQHFKQQFPSKGGHSVFLIDAPASQSQEISRQVPRFLADYGPEWMTTVEKLAQFNAIENTYLAIFLVLGGLALLLAAIGLGIVVLRNILERRHEFALLQALGYTREKIIVLVVREHLYLLLVGTIIGLLAAIFAILPAVLTPGSQVPYLTLLFIIIMLLLSGWVWIVILTRSVITKQLLSDLRSE